MTHVFDSSAILADIFGEPGASRVNELLSDPEVAAGVSVITLFETYTSVLHRQGSEGLARQTVATLRAAIGELACNTPTVGGFRWHASKKFWVYHRVQPQGN